MQIDYISIRRDLTGGFQALEADEQLSRELTEIVKEGHYGCRTSACLAR